MTGHSAIHDRFFNPVCIGHLNAICAITTQLYFNSFSPVANRILIFIQQYDVATMLVYFYRLCQFTISDVYCSFTFIPFPICLYLETDYRSTQPTSSRRRKLYPVLAIVCNYCFVFHIRFDLYIYSSSLLFHFHAFARHKQSICLFLRNH